MFPPLRFQGQRLVFFIGVAICFAAFAACSNKSSKKGSAAVAVGTHALGGTSKAAVYAPVPGGDNLSQGRPLLVIFAEGLMGGLAALLMPCILPLIPATVGYFSKKGGDKKARLSLAGFYGASIVLLYVGLGLVITVFFGAGALNRLASNGVVNIFFFLALALFALSLLGGFDLVLPVSWLSKADEKSRSRGIGGVFFLALLLTITSFSCTGPLVGALLVQAASDGQRLAPAAGMLGFSLALAFPFMFLAVSPSAIKKLPRSGQWQHTLKCSLGLLELALAMKFLSNADLAYHTKLLNRDVFLSVWLAIFALLSIFLMGGLRLTDAKASAYKEATRMYGGQLGISVSRLLSAVLALSFTVYLLPGLWGAPLKMLGGFLPPQSTQDFDLYTRGLSSEAGDTLAYPDRRLIRYAGILHAPLNLNAFFDYDQALAYAKQVHRPLLVDFTGHSCANCRLMEIKVWTDRKVLPILRDKYVLVELYVDDKSALDSGAVKGPGLYGKEAATIGERNCALEQGLFGRLSQPYYVLLSDDGRQLGASGAEYDASKYCKFLEGGLASYGQSQPQ